MENWVDCNEFTTYVNYWEAETNNDRVIEYWYKAWL